MDFSFLFRRQNTFPTTLCWLSFSSDKQIVKYCKYCVGIQSRNTFPKYLKYALFFTVLQNSPQAILYYCTHWVTYWFAVLQFSSESRFHTYSHFGKSGWWMLQCTCSNLAVLFVQPPLLLDHGWPSSSPSSSSYSHSHSSGSVSKVGIHCSKTEELTCCPFMLKLCLLIVELCDRCLPMWCVSVHIWMAVCSLWKQEIFCMKIVPNADNCV